MKVISSDDQKVPIFSWCPDVEATALKQAKAVANLPCIFHHVAIMPDCLTEDTEVLTNLGFKKIIDLTGKEKVANYNPKSQKIFFAYPKGVIIRNLKENESVHILKSTFLDKGISCTNKHRTSYKKDMGLKMEDVPTTTVLSDFVWGGSGLEKNIDLNIKYEMLCLIAWVVADGSIKGSNKKKDGTLSSYIVRFGLTKERKIKRIKHLLDALKYKYNIRVEKNNSTSIELDVNSSNEIIGYVGFSKSYPKNFIENLSTNQSKYFLEEAIKADGDWESFEKYGTIRYNSKRDEDVNFLSSLISIHFGIANNSSRWTEGYKKIKMNYLSVIDNNSIELSNNGMSKSIITKEPLDYKGQVVCISCDTGFFIARQNGLTFVTGNCHTGYGMPIGGVAALEKAVSPNMVGVDIGCGVALLCTNIKVSSISPEKIKAIYNEILKLIPTGMTHRKGGYQQKEVEELKAGCPKDTLGIIGDNAVDEQIGTLGSGNHFIELQTDDEDNLYVMVHSGSRNIGKRIACYHNDIAKECCSRWYTPLPDKDLAFLPLFCTEGQDYINDMEFSLRFAKLNRKTILDIIQEIMVAEGLHIGLPSILDIHHNYATMENHFGKNVMVHRKGAICAGDNYGLVPGAMGKPSYVVRGKSNRDSFMSSSHGAGRAMSRTMASNLLLVEDFEKDMTGIIADTSHKFLDEAPRAYKDIDEVMSNQYDLVAKVHKLHAIACIKGD